MKFKSKNTILLKTKAAAFLVFCSLSGLSPGHADETRPNVIFIYGDDVGIDQLSVYGGESYKTPHLDALAEGGLRFENTFAAALCSPSRAKLLTGRFPTRTGYFSNDNHVDLSVEKPFPQVLQAAGYATAVCGKWHLARTRADEHMQRSGFDDVGPFIKNWGGNFGSVSNYRPDEWQAWVVDYLKSRIGKSQPFFLYYPMQLVHNAGGGRSYPPTPLNPNGPKGSLENYPFMVEYMDLQVGQIVEKLEEFGLRKNTMIMFMGDNGTENPITSVYKGKSIKGQKERITDAGSWVPFIVNCPGLVPKGHYSGLNRQYRRVSHPRGVGEGQHAGRISFRRSKLCESALRQQRAGTGFCLWHSQKGPIFRTDFGLQVGQFEREIPPLRHIQRPV